ncbi:hypothetical protein WG947_09660 [Pontibacter sp. H259]|uniref:hypothetical protein n=1 Tax=Pontibacter sp. H259 TaxID=3133421 RepID=UPI0030C29584
MKAFKVFIFLFAVLGLWASVDFIIKLRSSQKEGRQYVANCSAVKVGMTLKDVREIKGDSTWNAMEESPQLYFNYSSDSTTYSLFYPSIIGASGSPVIQFDAATMRVNLVMCDIN